MTVLLILQKEMNKTTHNGAIYPSRGNHSILRVSFYPQPCFQADKVTAGLKATPRGI